MKSVTDSLVDATCNESSIFWSRLTYVPTTFSQQVWTSSALSSLSFAFERHELLTCRSGWKQKLNKFFTILLCCALADCAWQMCVLVFVSLFNFRSFSVKISFLLFLFTYFYFILMKSYMPITNSKCKVNIKILRQWIEGEKMITKKSFCFWIFTFWVCNFVRNQEVVQRSKKEICQAFKNLSFHRRERKSFSVLWLLWIQTIQELWLFKHLLILWPEKLPTLIPLIKWWNPSRSLLGTR